MCSRPPVPRDEYAAAMMESCDVVVVGAGPTGLVLALGLTQRGIDVVVLEKKHSIAEHSRAPGIWPPTQQVLADLGVLDRFLEGGITLPRVNILDVDEGRELLALPIDELADETAHPRLLLVPQSRTERLLCQALRDAGVAVRFGTEATSVTQHSGGAEVGWHAGGTEGRIAAKFVAGCDGASSDVRAAIDASFDGGTYDTHAALADLRLEGHDHLPFPRVTTRSGFAMALRIDSGLWRLVMPHGADDDTPLERRVAAAASALLPPEPFETVWQSEFRLHRRVASKLADGRIALAGDAAHLNSPAGGQGMNAGIADAADLTTALADGMQRGDAAPLEGYADRRRAAVETGVNPFTDRLTRVLLYRDGAMIRPALAAMRQVLRVGPLRRRFLRNAAMLDTV
jgi:3-(3-hydroxy-phenyl)propionate hydroxylase